MQDKNGNYIQIFNHITNKHAVSWEYNKRLERIILNGKYGKNTNKTDKLVSGPYHQNDLQTLILCGFRQCTVYICLPFVYRLPLSTVLSRQKEQLSEMDGCSFCLFGFGYALKNLDCIVLHFLGDCGVCVQRDVD